MDVGGGTAAPPSKRAKTLTDHFAIQHQAHDKACEFLLANAPKITPRGYKLLRQGIDDLKVQIDKALDEEDFERAEEIDAVEDDWQKTAELEETLLQKAIACKQHASNRYEYFRKHRRGNIAKIRYYSRVLKTAEDYLQKVPKADLEDTVEDPADDDDEDDDTDSRNIVLAVDADTDGGAKDPVNQEAQDSGREEEADEAESGEEEEADEVSGEEEEAGEADSGEEEANAKADGGSRTKPSKSGLREKFKAGVVSVAARKRKQRAYSCQGAKSRTKAVIDAPKPQSKGPKITEAQFERMLKKTYTITKQQGPKGAKKYVKEDVVMRNEPYWEWSNGYALCTCCNLVVPKAQVGQHCTSASHKKARNSAAKDDAEDTELGKKAQARLRAENLQGSSKNQKDNLILLRGLARANVALNAAEDMAPYLERWGGKRFPNVEALSDVFPDLHNFHLDKIKKKLKECFPEFSLIIDGSPFFANAECIVVRAVDKDFNIVELVIRLQLYDASLDAEAICDHVISAIEDRMDADATNWRVVMCDRASTNKSAVDKVGSKANLHPLAAYCISHGTNTIGKKFDDKKGRKWRQTLGKMVSAPLCKARCVHRRVFKQSAKTSSGVRFGIELEHAKQVNDLGVISLRDQHVRTCVENKYSEKSAKKALDQAKDPQDAAVISCEMAAVTDAGLPVISTTITSESDAPLVLIEDEVINDLGSLMASGVEAFPFPELEEKAIEAEAIMAEVMAPHKADIADNRANVEAKKTAVERAEEVLSEKEALANTSSRQGEARRGGRVNYARMSNPNGRATSAEMSAVADAREALAAAHVELKDAEDALAANICALDAFKDGKLATKEDFVAHGRRVVKPGFDHYHALFVDPSGDYYGIRQVYRVARIFNPRIAAGLDTNAIEEAINELNVFKMPEFTPAFREGMRKEVSVYKAAVDATALRNGTDDDFWSSVPGAKKYDESIAAKNAKSPGANKTWLDDPVEKARRLWEWWRANHNKFTCFSKAARLAVLVQTSSCAVERVFSQVKYIVETVGDSGLEETLEARLMERMNAGKH